MRTNRSPRALNLTLANRQQPFVLWNGQRYSLRDFSQKGIGLWMPPEASQGLKVGSVIKVDVGVGNETFSTQLEIKHLTQGIVGLQIVGADATLGDLLKQLLQPTLYAAQITANPTSGKDDLEMGYPRLWYQGPGGVELLLWYNGYSRMLIALQLCWLGKWVYRHQFDEPKTGFLPDSLELQGVRLQTKDLLSKHPQVDTQLIQQATQFLAAVPNPLPGPQLWQFLSMGEQVYLPPVVLPALRVA